MRVKKTSPNYQKVYDYLIAFKIANQGNSPTIREIGDACGVSSTSVVRYYLDGLVKAGLIERNKKGHRNLCISIPGARWLPPPHIKANAESEQWHKQEAKHLKKLLDVVRAA